jgi:hypothetical protein
MKSGQRPPTRYLCQFVLMWSLQRINPTPRVRAIFHSMLVFRKMTYWPWWNPENEDHVHHCCIRNYLEYLVTAFSIRNLNTQHNTMTSASRVWHTGTLKMGRFYIGYLRHYIFLKIPLQALVGPEGSRRLRLPIFKTIGTWRWHGCQPYALATRKYSWYSFLLEAESTPGP